MESPSTQYTIPDMHTTYISYISLYDTIEAKNQKNQWLQTILSSLKIMTPAMAIPTNIGITYSIVSWVGLYIMLRSARLFMKSNIFCVVITPSVELIRHLKSFRYAYRSDKLTTDMWGLETTKLGADSKPKYLKISLVDC